MLATQTAVDGLRSRLEAKLEHLHARYTAQLDLIQRYCLLSWQTHSRRAARQSDVGFAAGRREAARSETGRKDMEIWMETIQSRHQEDMKKVTEGHEAAVLVIVEEHEKNRSREREEHETHRESDRTEFGEIVEELGKGAEEARAELERVQMAMRSKAEALSELQRELVATVAERQQEMSDAIEKAREEQVKMDLEHRTLIVEVEDRHATETAAAVAFHSEAIERL
eukprot:3914975-Rhodomonas_salina.1